LGHAVRQNFDRVDISRGESLANILDGASLGQELASPWTKSSIERTAMPGAGTTAGEGGVTEEAPRASGDAVSGDIVLYLQSD
jgi:hypothetical protein